MVKGVRGGDMAGERWCSRRNYYIWVLAVVGVRFTRIRERCFFCWWSMISKSLW